MTPDSVGPRPQPLEEQAQQFADELNATVHAVAGSSAHPFVARANVPGQSEPTHLTIRQSPSEGVTLQVEGRPMLKLKVSYRCTWDHAHNYLAVDQSSFEVLASGTSEPLIRVDFLRVAQSGVPTAHAHVHAHRDAITHVMDHCGMKSKRAKNRRQAMAGGEHIPRLADLHIPLGGSRFRPCLEDLLEMLIDEFGVDAESGATEALAEGRIRWRKRQLAASVRDSPETAAEALRALGYEVSAPAEGALPDRSNMLGAL